MALFQPPINASSTAQSYARCSGEAYQRLGGSSFSKSLDELIAPVTGQLEKGDKLFARLGHPSSRARAQARAWRSRYDVQCPVVLKLFGSFVLAITSRVKRAQS